MLNENNDHNHWDCLAQRVNIHYIILLLQWTMVQFSRQGVFCTEACSYSQETLSMHVWHLYFDNLWSKHHLLKDNSCDHSLWVEGTHCLNKLVLWCEKISMMPYTSYHVNLQSILATLWCHSAPDPWTGRAYIAMWTESLQAQKHRGL